MIYNIFRNNIKVASVKPYLTSELSQKKQSEDVVKLEFELVKFVDIKIGDYIAYADTERIYTINKKPSITESPKKYQYECIFEGGIHELRKTKVFLETPKVGGGNYKDYKFPFTGNAQNLLNLVVNSLNSNGYNITAGSYKETEIIDFQFNNFNVFQAVSTGAELMGFNWYLEGPILNFDTRLNNQAYVFQVGAKKGFSSLVRSRVESESIATVVYGYGSTQNMPPRTGEGQTYDSELLTENRLSFDGEDGESKLVNNAPEFGSIELVKEFDIKPERIGDVTGIDADIRSFYDTTLDFDINDQLLEGVKPKVYFTTGKLIGRTFDISYNNSAKKITVDYNNDESGQYPNDIIFFEVGDSYKLVDIIMPESYILEAQTRLEAETLKVLEDVSITIDLYEGALDKEFILINNIKLSIGDFIRVVSGVFGIDNTYEIKELTQNVSNPNIYSVKFGDVVPRSLIGSISYQNFVTSQSIYNVQKNSVTNNEVTNIVGESSSWEEL